MTSSGVAKLPDYDDRLNRFHEAFALELRAMIMALPLTPGMRVLDFACGDGFYARCIGERLDGGGCVTGVDINLAYVAEASEEAARVGLGGRTEFVVAAFDDLPFPDDVFDFVWCAQSFFSLPDPVSALRHMRRVLRPGGRVAILENDSVHQVCLPWPVHLELPLRAAELRSFASENANASKFYVGRRLPAVIAAAGFETPTFTTQAIDRQAPLGEPERALLQSYLEDVARRVAPFLAPSLFEELTRLVDPRSPTHLLRDKYLSMTWLNVLAMGRRKAG